ncbi:MAG: dihydropteroate synthase [Acidobacteriia bacterium]|nr:dihydropteroate synthase [Terriglobia bacterium]
MRLRPEFEIKVAGRAIRLGERTLLMGVLNVTPDSFSDGGLYLAPERAIQRGLELVRQGADWIDVGGESTRPGSQRISAEEELRRVLPVIRGLRRKLRSVPISTDTTKAEVAEQALRTGANILNDVSGLRFDPRLAEVARRYRAPLVLMHLRGRPETMQQKPFAQNIWRSLAEGLETSLRRALAAGVSRSQIILDPGLGFGKSRRQNYEILAGLARLQCFRLPILVGSSRKSFVQAIVAGESLEPSQVKRQAAFWPMQNSAPLAIADAAAVVAAILGGAHIVRVHDPEAVLTAVRVADAVLAANNPR